MKRNFLIISLIFVLIVGLVGCTQGTTNTEEVTKLKIGVVAPMSGQSAIAGEYIKNGISLVVDELEQAGGLERNGKKIQIEVIYEDNEAKPDITSNVYRKLIEQDKAAFSPTSDDPVTKDFVDRYVKKFGVNPNSNAVLAYEAFKIVLKGIQEAKTLDGQGVRDAMAAIKDYKLPSGNFSFDENRNPIKSASIMIYKDGIPTFKTVINP